MKKYLFVARNIRIFELYLLLAVGRMVRLLRQGA